MLEEKEKQKTHYDIRHRVEEKKQSSTEDKVWIINMQREGVIEQKLDEPRYYRVRTDRDSTVRRNSRHFQVLPKQ
ncbi:unnamed protein product [Phaedon cochleariae]|uniref:Uncharacterized protein n=1 Tax=Phaedon cochleariae TaxID=80249 RepID=A0A9N9X4F4_PHACE|nr:unnamed protein product [Phaedon cochleariae]